METPSPAAPRAADRVIVRLWGGLGNQLFQYAAGWSVAAPRRSELLLDPTQCFLDKNRPYKLGCLNITGRTWLPSEQKSIERRIRLARPSTSQTRFAARILKSSTRRLLAGRFHYLEDRHQGFQPEIFKHQGDIYLAGTWASPQYFADHRTSLLREFTFNDAPDLLNAQTLAHIRDTNALCIHVRRGDYVANPDTAARFGTCSPDYYRRAFALLAPHLKNPVAFLFSDDPDWCRDNLQLPCERHIISHNLGTQDHEDLRLMAACNHFIIANSTFSWWAAWLATHPEKTIVAPKVWSIDTQSIGDPVPLHWIRI